MAEPMASFTSSRLARSVMGLGIWVLSAASSAVSVTVEVLVLSGAVVEESAVLLLQAVKTMLIAAVQTAVARKAEIIRFIVVFSLLMIKIPSYPCIVCRSLRFMYSVGPIHTYKPKNSAQRYTERKTFL